MTKKISYLIESELTKASVVLAVKSITDKLQNLAENMAKIEANDIMPILDNMQVAFGQETTDQFNHAATDKLRAVINSLKEAKESLTSFVAKMEGTVEGTNDMSSDSDFGDDLDVDADADADADTSDMATDDAAADDFSDDFSDDAGADAQPEEKVTDFDMGRAKKESFERNVKALRESSNPDALVFATFVKLYPSVGKGKETAKIVAEAFGIEYSDVIEIVKEGKSWSNNPDSNNYKSKQEKNQAKFAAAARAKKKADPEEDLDEGKSWSNNPDSNSFKSKNQQKQSKAAQDTRRKKNAGDEEMEEGFNPLLKGGKEASMARSIKKVAEEFDMKPTTKSKKGMFDGWTQAELKSELSSVKKQMKSYEDQDKKVPDELRSKFSELTFALRAKHNWGAVEEGKSWSNNPDSNAYKSKNQQKTAKYAQDQRKKKPSDEEELDEAFGKRNTGEPAPYQTPAGVVPLKQIFRHMLDKNSKEEAEALAKADFKKFVNKTVEALYVFGIMGEGETKQYNSKVNNPFLVKVLNNSDLVLSWNGDVLAPKYRVAIVDGKGIIPSEIKSGVIHAPQYRVQGSDLNHDDTPFT